MLSGNVIFINWFFLSFKMYLNSGDYFLHNNFCSVNFFACTNACKFIINLSLNRFCIFLFSLLISLFCGHCIPFKINLYLDFVIWLLDVRNTIRLRWKMHFIVIYYLFLEICSYLFGCFCVDWYTCEFVCGDCPHICSSLLLLSLNILYGLESQSIGHQK